MMSTNPVRRRPTVNAGMPPLLYVDALNYQSVWFNRNDITTRSRSLEPSGDLWEDVKAAPANIMVFMREAKAAGWKVTAFLDMVKVQENEVETFWNRKRKIMEAGGTDHLPFMTIVLGNLFETEGATVHYAAETDNDPTLATYAKQDNAAVLSADGDFLRYYSKRETGEHDHIKRHFASFSVGDKRNHGKLALWEKKYDKQERDKAGWVFVNGIGEVKGGAEEILPSKPYTTPIFKIDPPGQFDHKSRLHIRIGVINAFPFAFPALDPCAHVTAERLLLPLRLAVYQMLKVGERGVVESFLEWKEYSDGWLPEKVQRCWKFRGAEWDQEHVDGQRASGTAPAACEADDWEQLADGQAEGPVTEEESTRVRRLVQDIDGFKQTAARGARPEQMLHHLSGVYAVVFGPPCSNIPNHLRPQVRGAWRQAGDDEHAEVGGGGGDGRGDVVDAALRGGENGREMLEVEDAVASGERLQVTGDAGRECAARGSLPESVWDVREKEAGRREVTFIHCRNEIICRFMAVLAWVGTCHSTIDGDVERCAFYAQAFWLLQNFLDKNGLVAE